MPRELHYCTTDFFRCDVSILSNPDQPPSGLTLAGGINAGVLHAGCWALNLRPPIQPNTLLFGVADVTHISGSSPRYRQRPLLIASSRALMQGSHRKALEIASIALTGIQLLGNAESAAQRES